MLTCVRYVIPAVIVLAGVILLIVRDADRNSLIGAGAFWGAGLAVLLLNVLYRLGVSGDAERDREEEARQFLERHGHWPDEPPPDDRGAAG